MIETKELLKEEPEMIEEEFTDGPPTRMTPEPKEEEITNEPEIAREEVKEETNIVSAGVTLQYICIS